MQRLRLKFASETSDGTLSFDVPDISTALIVAEINQANGHAEIHDGSRLVATLERRSGPAAPYWRIS